MGCTISGIDQAGQFLSVFLFCQSGEIREQWSGLGEGTHTHWAPVVWCMWGASAQMKEYPCGKQPVDLAVWSGFAYDVWAVFHVDAFFHKTF